MSRTSATAGNAASSLPARPLHENAQLAALTSIHELFDSRGIEYWLFGGWAVDFHAGKVSRAHDDLDLAVWWKDDERIAVLLAGEGWRHAPEAGEDGYTGYERGDVRLELAFRARREGRDLHAAEGMARYLARRIVRQ